LSALAWLKYTTRRKRLGYNTERGPEMPIGGDRYPRTEKNLKNAPKTHGVYALYEGSRLIYIGRAAGTNVTINSRLNDHARGDDGPCTQAYTHYQREETSNAKAREEQLLEEYKKANGQLPPCNERVG
jgi:hypothetical protein